MAIYKKGADPVALRASAERITGHARECDTVKGEASRAVHALRGQWGGGDLDQLMNRWPPIEAQLTQFGTDLGKLAEALRRNAGQQDTASGQGSGGAGPLGPVGPLGPGSASVGNGGIPGYDLTKALFTPFKLAGTLGSVAGLALKLKNFSNNLGGFDSELGLFKNLKNAWNTGRLAEFGDALAPKNWSTLSRFVPALEDGSKLAKGLGTFGKFLGPAGVALGGFTVANDIAGGHYGRATYDGAMTALGAVALVPIPPVNAIAGAAAGAMAVGELVYDHWDDISHFAGEAGHAISDAAGDVADFAGDVADKAGDVLSSLNPFD
ncbi:hypothetical protein GCM10009868_19310 [Terrabacter aerolatus]|uniref:WXG100 family type VII secretion target n=1 Tax=Terrabacter aerolatus TaxID=422442 RepID=A0A512D013_9MICO|nr:hypothetical protein [Terrabacter aerolatus]GEO29802.1 hypothetical protein TAE01_16120 [Terrabacter aerolatus]